MNSYSIPFGNITQSKELLRAIALGLFYSKENYTIHQFFMEFRVPFSLDNIDIDAVIQNGFSSKHQRVIENFDKPVVEAGDLILAFVSPTDSIKEYFDDYLLIENVALKEDIDPSNVVPPVGMSLYVGISNSSQSDFNDPFSGLTKIVINKIKALSTGTMIEEISRPSPRGNSYSAGSVTFKGPSIIGDRPQYAKK